MRIKIGFSNPDIMIKIVEKSIKMNLSKSQFVENTVRKYFEHNADENVTLGFGKYFRKGERLQVNFKDEKLIKLIEIHAKKYNIPKSKLIDYILNRYLNSKNEKKEKFQRNIFSRRFHFYIKNNKKTRLELLEEGNLNINIASRSLSLSKLNKAYNKEIKTTLALTLENGLTNDKLSPNGFYYLTLVNEAKVISRRLIIKEKITKNKNESNLEKK